MSVESGVVHARPPLPVAGLYHRQRGGWLDARGGRRRRVGGQVAGQRTALVRAAAALHPTQPGVQPPQPSRVHRGRQVMQLVRVHRQVVEAEETGDEAAVEPVVVAAAADAAQTVEGAVGGSQTDADGAVRPQRRRLPVVVVVHEAVEALEIAVLTGQSLLLTLLPENAAGTAVTLVTGGPSHLLTHSGL